MVETFQGSASSHTCSPRSRLEGAPRLPVAVLGLSISLFLAITYVLCIIGYLVLPDVVPVNHAALEVFLPGFKLLNWPSFLLGLVESAAYGWYVALIFGPLFNFLAMKIR